jgi:hypothetical protein
VSAGVKKAPAPADPAAEVARAQAAVSAVKRQLRNLVGQVAEIRVDLDTRRAGLSPLAADGPAFREAVAYISAEEDRERALTDVLIPETEAELDLAEHALDGALNASARARIKAAIEGRLFPAQLAVVKNMLQLEAALIEFDRVCAEIRGTVTDPRAGGCADDVLHPRWLVWGMPAGLRARVHGWAGDVTSLSIGYKPDLAAWHRERLASLFNEGRQ